MDKDQFQLLIRTLDAPKWTDLLSTAVITITAIVAIIAVFYTRKQLINDHRRSERKLAMDMCMKWSESTAPETSSVTRLIERLTSQQVDAVASLTKLVIEVEYKHHLVNILQLRFPTIEDDLETSFRNGDFYHIEGRHLQHIRYIAVRYLNTLESILLAWAQGIADHDVIVSEFGFLADGHEHRTAMEEFRNKLGVNTMPSIASFILAARKAKRDASSVQRPALPG